MVLMELMGVLVALREHGNGHPYSTELSRDMSVGARFAKKSTAGRGDTLPDPALEGSPDVLRVRRAGISIKRENIWPGRIRPGADGAASRFDV